MTPPDSAVVRRVLAGDTDAFAILVERHHARCLRLAAHLLGARDDADDAVQEAFLRAYRHLARYEERERFAGWLLRIVVNECRTALGRRRRDEVRRPEWEREAAFAACGDEAERLAQGEELSRALGRLCAEQREAIALRFGEELSYDEMAAVTGAGVSAMKMRVRRACARLRALLAEVHHA